MYITLKQKLTIQATEMMEHKYFLSEKAHKDVGEQASALDWSFREDEIGMTEREKFNKRFNEHIDDIAAACQQYCPNGCPKEQKYCVMGIDKIHELLEDSPYKR